MKNKNSPAPIVMFVYNRLFHTRMTFEALQKNTLASDSELYIYADAPKNKDMEKECKELREFLHTYKKDNKIFKHITIVERAYNYGLAENISQGVTDIVNKYGRVVVVEDDMVMSPHTLEYLNSALDFYEDKKSVFHISAWSDLFDKHIKEDAFLWRMMDCWLWATWKDRWEHFEMNASRVFGDFTEKDKYKFCKDGTEEFLWGLALGELSNAANGARTWDVYWYATIFNRGGLCLSPTESLVRNIGNDYSGTNCVEKLGLLHQTISNKKEWVFPTQIEEHAKVFSRIKKYNLHQKKHVQAMTAQIDRDTAHNVKVLFGEPEEKDKGSGNKNGISSISRMKSKLRKKITGPMVKLWPPFVVLEMTRNKVLEQTQKIAELENAHTFQNRWNHASNFPYIRKYSKGMNLLTEFVDIDEYVLETLLAHVENKAYKNILSIGTGLSTPLLAAVVSKSIKEPLKKAVKKPVKHSTRHTSNLLCIDYNSPRLIKVKNSIYNLALSMNVDFYNTQLVYHTLEAMDGVHMWSYNMKYFQKQKTTFDLIILGEETEGIQAYSTFAQPLLLEQYINSKSVFITNKLSNNTKKLIPIWEEYFLGKGIRPKFLEL